MAPGLLCRLQTAQRPQPEDGTSYWARIDRTLDIIDNDLSDGATIVIIEQSDFALEFTVRLELLP
jgi:hypothetical protein